MCLKCLKVNISQTDPKLVEVYQNYSAEEFQTFLKKTTTFFQSKKKKDSFSFSKELREDAQKQIRPGCLNEEKPQKTVEKEKPQKLSEKPKTNKPAEHEKNKKIDEEELMVQKTKRSRKSAHTEQIEEEEKVLEEKPKKKVKMVKNHEVNMIVEKQSLSKRRTRNSTLQANKLGQTKPNSKEKAMVSNDKMLIEEDIPVVKALL